MGRNKQQVAICLIEDTLLLIKLNFPNLEHKNEAVLPLPRNSVQCIFNIFIYILVNFNIILLPETRIFCHISVTLFFSFCKHLHMANVKIVYSIYSYEA
jgi:hypothetical protein